MQIQKDKVVGFHFTAYFEDGSISDTSRESGPVNILIGHGNVMPALEEALKGMKIGESKSITVPPEQGFGMVEPSKFQEFSTKVFNVQNMEVGSPIAMKTSDGYDIPGVIHEIKDDLVTIDFNHPLAGQTLKFDLELLEVRDASHEELSHGHVHGPGGHHH